jgi:hypothetical protein
MRSSLSQVESLFDLSNINDEEKPVREIHRRSQKAFDLNDAHTLKVIQKKFDFIKNKFLFHRMKLINRSKMRLENLPFLNNVMKHLVRKVFFLCLKIIFIYFFN